MIVLIAQVWTWLYNFLECDQDPDYKAQSWKYYFKLSYSDENYLKFNMFPKLGLTIIKSSPRNVIHQKLSNSIKSLLQFLKKIKNNLENFLWQYSSIFNNCCVIGLNIIKSPWCTPTRGGLSNETKTLMTSVMVWKISMWQTNKHVYLINRLWVCSSMTCPRWVCEACHLFTCYVWCKRSKKKYPCWNLGGLKLAKSITRPCAPGLN
jgi:hypothetical protein